MNNRDHFAQLLGQKEALLLQRKEIHEKFEADYVAECDRAAVPFQTSKKKKALFLPELAPELHREIRTTFIVKLGEAVQETLLQLDEVSKELRATALLCDIQPGDLELRLTSVCTVSYNSQGFSASQYAKGAAEMSADAARLANVPVSVVRRLQAPTLPWSSAPLEYWDVVVRVQEQLDFEILKLRPEPPLKEQVRLCWARGVNPRVYNPFLPYGYEKENGITYEGTFV
jgi:hypothetical protein